jgi:V/A-type H+-transporting ATPase subunit I
LKSLLLIGGTYLIFTYFFDLTAWLSPPYPILYVVIPTILLLIAKPIGKIFFRVPYLNESLGEMFGFGTIDLAETFLNILSNVASYSRILALAMAHMGLMLIITTLVDMVGSIRFLIPIILILGNLIVIVLEGFLVFIHTLRLHFYEFFGKFYAGDGILYHNIQIKNDFSEVKFTTTNTSQNL